MSRRPQQDQDPGWTLGLGRCSQRGGAGGRGHAAVVEPVLTQTPPQAADGPFHLAGSFPGEGGLQLGPLGAHLLVLGLDVILAVLALELGTGDSDTCEAALAKTPERRGGRAHQVDDLRAGVPVPLGGLAGAEVLGLPHEEDLLWVVHRQAYLRKKDG